MKFLLQVLLLLITFITPLFSQDYEKDFEINTPLTIVHQSNYRTIKLIDSRIDTTNLGIVQVGALNHPAWVKPKRPLFKELKSIVDSSIDANAKNGEMLLHLRILKFSEVTKPTSERGYCALRADLYAKTGDKYQKLSSIDTLICKSSMDVTNAILKAGGATITNFISSSLAKEGTHSDPLSMHEVLNIDSIEKSKIKVYRDTNYVDGLYLTYQSFKNQTPDYEATVVLKDGDISKVRIVDEFGDIRRVNSRKAYALVYKKQPYIATYYNFYPAYKVNNDFCFTGAVRMVDDTEVFMASMFMGAAGGLLASIGTATIYDIKIDHKNGQFIYLKEIDEYSEEE